MYAVLTAYTLHSLLYTVVVDPYAYEVRIDLERLTITLTVKHTFWKDILN